MKFAGALLFLPLAALAASGEEIYITAWSVPGVRNVINDLGSAAIFEHD